MFSYVTEESVEKPEETVKQVVEEIVVEAVSALEETPAKAEEAVSALEETPAKTEDIVVADKPETTLDKCVPGFTCTIM